MAYEALDFGTSANNDGASLKDTMTAIDTMLAELYTVTGKGASLIGIEDAGGLITATTVEGALAENRTAIDAIEADYLTSAAIGTSVQAYDADLAEWAGVNPSENGKSLVSAVDYAAMRTLLSLVPGTNVQGYASLLADLAGLTLAQGDIFYFNGTNLTKLTAGTTGQVLQTQGAGANPQWSNAGAGDVTAALAFGADNVLLRADGTGKGVQATGIAVDDSNNVSGLNRLDFADAKGIHDANGNEVLLFGATVSAVNELKATNAATGNKPVLAAQGGDTNIIMQLQGKGTGGVELEGTSTNDNATTGYVGEVISSGVASGSAVAISSATYGTVTSIDLTAGDWDVQAQIAFTGSATGITQFLGGISTSTSVVGNAEDVTQSRFGLDCASYNASTLQVFSIAPCRVSVTVTTTYYLIGRMSFTGGSAGVCGRIFARRVR